MKLNLTAIRNIASGKFARAALMLRKHGPEIATGAGIICGVACVITACVQTTKIEKVIDDAKDKIGEIHEMNEKLPEKYDDKAKKSDLVKVYARSGVDILRIYALPAGLGALSVAFIIGGHKMLRKENAALAAAYVALNESFMQYRSRVKENQGADADKEYMYGRKTVEMIDMTDPDHPGEPITSFVNVGKNISPYARFFDAGNPNFGTTPESSLMFLKGVEIHMNDIFHRNGFLFLNEVYDALGIPRSNAGQFVGWVEGMGDDFVDFGLGDVSDPQVRAFVNGDEEAVLLDFNVDGPIMYIFDKLCTDGTYRKEIDKIVKK